MIVALASPRVATSLDDGFARIERLIARAAEAHAEVVCFPEAYLPGLRGQDFDVLSFDRATEAHVRGTVAGFARKHRVATILGTEAISDAGRQIAAVVFDRNGDVLAVQTKNQIDPSEDRHYVPGTTRQIFDVNGVKFGIAICHEGWRYPETVRWAAVRGAKIVFHPQHTGAERSGIVLDRWGSPNAPYYEKAMVMRSIENSIYFASVNYALRFQESATAVISPTGTCEAHLPYGEEGVLVHEIDPDKATGLIATRFAPERYGEGA